MVAAFVRMFTAGIGFRWLRGADVRSASGLPGRRTSRGEQGSATSPVHPVPPMAHELTIRKIGTRTSSWGGTRTLDPGIMSAVL